MANRHSYEVLRRLLLAGPPAARYQPTSGQATQFAGLAMVASGAAFQTISLAGIGAADLVFATPQGVNSGAGPIMVNSIVDGTSFAVARQDGAAAGDVPVSWIVFRGEP